MLVTIFYFFIAAVAAYSQEVDYDVSSWRPFYSVHIRGT